MKVPAEHDSQEAVDEVAPPEHWLTNWEPAAQLVVQVEQVLLFNPVLNLPVGHDSQEAGVVVATPVHWLTNWEPAAHCVLHAL